MEDKDVQARLTEIETRLQELDQREKKLHNVALKLSAVVMVLSEKLQEKKMLNNEEFEKRVQANLKSLDREISDRRTRRMLDNLLF